MRFHQGTTELLGASPWQPSADGASAAEIVPGRSAYVRIRLEAPAVLTRGDRFILRGILAADDDWRRAGARSASAARRSSHGSGVGAISQAGCR